MGKKSRAQQARINNLPNLAKKLQTLVEDEEDQDYLPPADKVDLLEHSFFVLDEYSDSDSDSEIDLEDRDLECELEELRNEEEIHHFGQILSEAQALAVMAEREATEGRPNRKRHYTGNSVRTKRYHAMKRRQLADQGQRFIHSWFSQTPKKAAVTETMEDSASSLRELETVSQEDKADLDTSPYTDSDLESVSEIKVEDNPQKDVAESLIRLFLAPKLATVSNYSK